MLKQRAMDGITYAVLVGKAISNIDTLNMLIVVVARIKLFSNQYQQ